jgi:hypothetical protein
VKAAELDVLAKKALDAKAAEERHVNQQTKERTDSQIAQPDSIVNRSSPSPVFLCFYSGILSGHSIEILCRSACARRLPQRKYRVYPFERLVSLHPAVHAAVVKVM